MSKDWCKDIHDMHTKFKAHEWVKSKMENKEYYLMNILLEFRLNFLKEELNETAEAIINKNPEEIVDGLIDLCVVAIGTLDLLGVDSYRAWNAVHNANMTKKAGIKPNRPNPLGLPDLMKPDNWIGPDHTGNHGVLNEIYCVQVD